MSKVFITGGSGSLGTALIERLLPSDELTVYSRDEWKQGELKREFPDVRFMLGDVRDYDRLHMAMRGQEVVIHAAAYKQVPSAEANVDEAVRTNVLGSMNVARAAVLNGVQYVVGVSTDKSCMPINAYGQTKALMEKLFQQAEDWSDTFFNCVRYGNVLGSRGSVVPLFRRQLAEGIRYTLTDPDMTRFWLTMEDAVDAVVACFDEADGGDAQYVEGGAILVPKYGASTMLDLLEAVHSVYGNGSDLTEDDYEVIGVRPGEKIHECLVHRNESVHTITAPMLSDYYQVLPSDARMHDKPFEFTSDTAVRLSIANLITMLQDEDEDEAKDSALAGEGEPEAFTVEADAQ